MKIKSWPVTFCVTLPVANHYSSLLCFGESDFVSVSFDCIKITCSNDPLVEDISVLRVVPGLYNGEKQ